MTKYIITGPCCSGKTTIINMLKKIGHQTLDEIARQIIKQQQQLENGILPWNSKKDLLKFQYLVINAQIKQEKFINGKTYFLDRSVIDGLGYLHNANIKIPKNLEEKAFKQKYNKAFFLELLPQKYYENDNQRTETYQQANHLQNSLKQAYKQSEIETIIIPNTLNPKSRLDMILNNI